MRLFVFSLAFFAAPAIAGEILLGTIATTRSENGIALFGTTGGTSYALRQGQTLNGWTIAHVAPRAVLLRRDERELRLEAGDLLEPNAAVPITTGIERRGNELLVTQVLRDFIAGEGLIAILMQAAATPVDGGYLLTDIDAGSAYELAGIQNGDVVTHIDGEELSNPIAALASLKRAAESSKFSFTFRRHGEQRTITVAVR